MVRLIKNTQLIKDEWFPMVMKSLLKNWKGRALLSAVRREKVWKHWDRFLFQVTHCEAHSWKGIWSRPSGGDQQERTRLWLDTVRVADHPHRGGREASW